MYDEGRGVAQDAREAVRWYRRAAAQGEADALNNLGLMYQEGRGVHASAIIAYALFSLARAQDEDTTAQENLDTLAATMSAADIAAAQRLTLRLGQPEHFLPTLDQASNPPIPIFPPPPQR